MSLSVGTELFILFVSAKLVFMKMLNIGEIVAIMQLTGVFVQPLMNRKSVLILDESMSAIDKKSAYDIEKRLLEMEGVTVLAITHDIHSPLLKMYL